MGTPVTIEVTVDDVEYSRYEEDKNTITASVVVSGGAPYTDEEVLVELVKARRQRDAAVASATLSFTGNVDPQEGEVQFYLPDIVDQDLIHLVRHGKYFVKATSVNNDLVFGDSVDFDISVVSVERLKQDFLFGLDLTATVLKAPKFQPSTLPIEIVEVSKSHPLGFATLTYNYHKDNVTNATASIGVGLNGTVVITADGDNAGDCGNLFAVTVQIPAMDGPLSATAAGPNLVVNLAVSGGLPDDPANTATLIAEAISALDGFTAAASGTGAASIDAAEGPTPFLGGVSSHVRTLSWNGGPAVSITGPGIYMLPMGMSGPAAGLCTAGNKDYVCVRVRSIAALPTYGVTESILIDKKTMDDDTLRRFLCQAVSWVEKDFLATPIEPTNVVTDRDPTTIQYSAGVNAPTPIYTDTDFDEIVSPLTYFVPRTQGAWVQIQTPHPQLLRMDSLFGAIANTRVIDIDLEWIEHSEQGGLVQLVPFNQEIAFDFIGLIWVNAIRGATELPNFWHYNAIVGLRQASCEIQELVAKYAAINALVIAGQALRPGIGSVSLSRDGVSESVSYTQTAEYGIYTGTIKAYKDWIKEEGDKLRAKYRGVTMVIV